MIKRRSILPRVAAAGLLAGGLCFACGEVTRRPDVYGEQVNGRPMVEPSTTTSSTDGEVTEGGELSDAGEDASTTCATCTIIAAAENPQSLALDLNNVYWTNDGPTTSNGDASQNSGSVESVPRSSVMGTGTPLDTGLTGPIIIACADGWLVWSAAGNGAGQGNVSQLSTSGSTPTTPGTSLSAPWGVAVDATKAYWVASAGAGVGILVQYSPLATTAANLVGTTILYDTPGGLAVNASTLFFAATSSTAQGGAIFQVPISGGTPVAVWTTGSGHPQDVAVDSSNLYWVDYDAGNLYSTPLTGGMAKTGVTPNTMASGLVSPVHLAVDSKNVYVADFGAGTILEVPIAGGMPLTLASGLDAPLGIAVDDSPAPNNVVYFTTPSSILSAPKM